MKNQHYTLHNYNGTKNFTNICSNFSSIEYAHLSESRFRSRLCLTLNGTQVELIINKVFPNLAKKIQQLKSLNTDTWYKTDEELQVFYMQHNIKENEFLDFIKNLPSTIKNGKFLYCKTFKGLV